jgi:hypothetical protein
LSDLGRLSVLIRPELYTDHKAIRALTARAFAGVPWSDGSEPRVIDGLRDADALACSLGAVQRYVSPNATSASANGWSDGVAIPAPIIR